MEERLKSELSRLRNAITSTQNSIKNLREFRLEFSSSDETHLQRAFAMNLLTRKSEWKMVSQECKVIITEDGTQLRCWQISWSSLVWTPLTVRQHIEVVFKNGQESCTKIKGLENELIVSSDYKLEELIRSECSDLMLYCSYRKDPQFFFNLLAMYFNLFVGRANFLQENDIKYKINTNEDGIVELVVPVEGVNDKGKSVQLGVLYWDIEMDKNAQFMKETYKVDLNAQGQKLAGECNFPKEFLTDGYYKMWTVKECIERVLGMAKVF